MLLEDLIIELETLRTQYGGDMDVKIETPITERDPDTSANPAKKHDHDTCLGANIQQGPLRYVLLERE